MRLFAIGDLHLSFGVPKRMNVFRGWEDYEQRIKASWQEVVGAEDLVVIAGDISWGMKLEETVADFEFIEALPGQKLIMKGNHDYWWSSAKKIEDFWAQNHFNSLKILHNNAFLFKDVGLCGSRGWLLGEGDLPDEKVTKRETMRLERSILAALAQGAKELIVFLHYPPVFMNQQSEQILEVLERYSPQIRLCCYAHLHGETIKLAFEGTRAGIEFRLISADKLNFKPLELL